MAWTLYLRAPDLSRVAVIEDYQTLECVSRYRDVGTWQLTLPAGTDHAAALMEPQYGIVLVRDDNDAVFSGRVRQPERQTTETSDVVTVSGVDDNVVLANRVVHPQPWKAAPPYDSVEYDVRSGTASTVLMQYVSVNAGPAALAPRREPGLVLGIDPQVGTQVTGRGRWQQLLTLEQELAVAGGVGWRVRQTDNNRLEFQVWQPRDLSSVVLSQELGNVTEVTYQRSAPEMTYVYCGGSGEGAARVIREGQANPSGWDRIERFQDRRDTASASELNQEIVTRLTEGSEQTTLSVTPVDGAEHQYLTHYDLGDTVTVVPSPGVRVTDVIREVRVKLAPDSQTVVPTISATSNTVLKIYQQLRQMAGRLRNLERR